MKLYHFNPNGFDNHYSVMAINIMFAHESLLNFLINQNKTAENKSIGFNSSEAYKKWKKVNPLDITTLPDSYSIDEYNANEIIEIETN